MVFLDWELSGHSTVSLCVSVCILVYVYIYTQLNIQVFLLNMLNIASLYGEKPAGKESSSETDGIQMAEEKREKQILI